MLWVTNMPAPYRIPLWDEVSHEFQLQVLFGLPANNWRGWHVPVQRKWGYQFFSNKYLKIGEYEMPLRFFGLNRYVKSQDVVVVGGWENPFYLSIIILCRYYKIPFFIFYGDGRRKVAPFNPQIFLKKIIFKTATGIVSLSHQTTRNLLAMGFIETKIVTLFNPHDQKEAAKVRRYEPTDDSHKFIFIGQLIDRKSPIELFEAFVRVSNPQDTLTFLGSGKLQDTLVKKIVTGSFEKRIKIEKPINPEDVLNYLRNFDTLVLPSKEEIWGQVVNEAYALGLNIVLSENCGVTEYVRGSEGVFVCHGELEDLAYCLDMARKFKISPLKLQRGVDFSSSRFATLFSEHIKDRLKYLG
jgi:glycosyltransferase involved in cell wall biosynthesis